MVEMAAVVPVMLILLLGVAELGRALFQYTALVKTVRDGARYCAGQALFGDTGVVRITGALSLRTKNLVVSGDTGGGPSLLPGLAPANITVTDAGGNHIRVTGVYTYQPMLGGTLPSFGLGSSTDVSFSLRSSAVMRAL
jgi:hypothetical protein